MAVCLVTGGAGFLGSHLAEALVADRHVVRVLDNFSTGKLENLAGVMDAIELYPGNYLDSLFLGKVLRGVEWLFHFAGGSPPGEGGGDLLHLLAAAVEARVRRVLFASSMQVYGGAAPQPASETDLTEPISPWGRDKLTGEHACARCTQLSGLETVRLRFFHVFGPRQPPDGPFAVVVRDALSAMLEGQSPHLGGEAHGTQDLLYVEDAVHATLLAARSPRVAGKAYNIARGQPTTSREVVDTLNDLLGTHLLPVYTGRPTAADLQALASVRRAEVDLGFCAATGLRRGLGCCLQGGIRLAASNRPRRKVVSGK